MTEVAVLDLADRCPRCGLPWADHPYSEVLRDNVCVQVELQEAP